MEKERSLGITMVSWAEIAIGAIIFLFSLALMVSRQSTWGLLIPYELPTCIISIFIIISGKLTLQLNSLGRKMNIILFWFLGVLCLTSSFFNFPPITKIYLIGGSSINIVSLVSIILVVLSAYVSFYPKVKEQFE